MRSDGQPRRTPESEWVALVRAIGKGDQSAFRQLFSRMHALVFTLIFRIVHDPDTAEELTLDVFHGVWTRAAQYRADAGSVVGWVMSQARSRAIDHIRFATRLKRVNPFPDSSEATPDSTGERLDAMSLATRLRSAVAGLSPSERTAIETAFFSELSYVEAASYLREPAGTVKARIRSAIEKLRVAMLKDGES